MGVSLGIDNIKSYLHIFKNKRVGLVTNPTGLNSKFESTVDILARETNLTALYSPEHGVRGDIQAGEKVEEYIDEKTNVKVYTLYGKTKKPTKEMLEDVDVIVFDIQDVGSRLYTYLYTLSYCMQAAKEYGKAVVVLDRPNPVNGIEVEGNLIQEGFTSFVGLHPIPYRYGLTVGELANYFNAEFNIECELTVIKMTGWRREMYFEQTGLPWVLPSPNMPTVETAVVYNATCLFEGTNISEGRGTTKPFEMVGAPWINANFLSETLNAKFLGGVMFRPVYFMPTFSKHKDVLCKGVQLHVTDRSAFKPVLVGLHLLDAIKTQDAERFEFLKAYTETGKPMIDYNTGSDVVRTTEFNPTTLYRTWEAENKEYLEKKKKYHLYE